MHSGSIIKLVHMWKKTQICVVKHKEERVQVIREVVSRVTPGLNPGGGIPSGLSREWAQDISGAGLVHNKWKSGRDPKGEAKK